MPRRSWKSKDIVSGPRLTGLHELRPRVDPEVLSDHVAELRHLHTADVAIMVSKWSLVRVDSLPADPLARWTSGMAGGPPIPDLAPAYQS